MKNKTFGFIGCGNMGGALATAVSRVVDSSHIYICGKSARRAEALSKSLGCSVLPKEDIARKCDFIFLGVKPQMMAEMLSEISPVLAERTERFVLVSMAGGLSMERILQMAGGSYQAADSLRRQDEQGGRSYLLRETAARLKANKAAASVAIVERT